MMPILYAGIVLAVILFTKIEKPSIFRMLIPFPFKQFKAMLKVGVPSAMETFALAVSVLRITMPSEAVTSAPSCGT